MKNDKGFTLVEVLATIVLLGILTAMIIPSVTKYLQQERVSYNPEFNTFGKLKSP